MAFSSSSSDPVVDKSCQIRYHVSRPSHPISPSALTDPPRSFHVMIIEKVNLTTGQIEKDGETIRLILSLGTKKPSHQAHHHDADQTNNDTPSGLQEGG